MPKYKFEIKGGGNYSLFFSKDYQARQHATNLLLADKEIKEVVVTNPESEFRIIVDRY